MQLDALDRKIIAALMTDGRVTWAQLATEVGLSGPSVTDRVRKLEKDGVVEGYSARISAESVGYGLLAFVSVAVGDPRQHERLLAWAQATPEVQEFHVVAGDFDYLVKIRCRDARHLERLLRQDVRSAAGMMRTNSTIVLATKKETSAIPLAATPTDRPPDRSRVRRASVRRKRSSS